MPTLSVRDRPRQGDLHSDHRPEERRGSFRSLRHTPPQESLIGVNVRGRRKGDAYSKAVARVKRQMTLLPTLGRRLMPVKGRISSPFGMRDGIMHTGIDIAVPIGTPVIATHSGYFKTEMNYGGGTMIRGRGGAGWETIYAHLLRSNVGTGRWVFAGEVIGLSGMSGALVTGPHVHYEVIYNGRHANPLIHTPLSVSRTLVRRRRRAARLRKAA